MSASDDERLYGGGQKVHILTPTGVDEGFIAKDVMLTGEFDLVTVEPGVLAENQESAAFLLTAKGRRNGQKAMSSVTLVFEPEMAIALVKALRLKWTEIPVHLR